MVPGRLRQWAGIEGEVVLFGKRDHLEVWNLKRIEEEIEANPFTDEDLDALTRDLAALDAN
ncbi:MAG: division/cell wall cluster transcriptional repressor MraZ, partial [Holophagales bacterium]|nr:division/cell wall cluster transcriptional repressor MraZ [Holophagales bacterium]